LNYGPHPRCLDHLTEVAACVACSRKFTCRSQA
jgi:hypothetical protein